MNLPIPILSVLIGAVILFFGRKLFWLCVAAAGFVAGAEIAPHLVHEPSPLLQLTVALVLGLIGALLAFLLQKIAEKEDIKVSQEEVARRVQQLAAMYQMPFDQFIKDLQKRNGVNELYEQVLHEKVLELLEKNAAITESAPAK